MLYKGFEAVIGLEIHAELACRSKIFCACSTAFGAPPNTQVCPVCMGHPGTLPRLNRQAVEYAIMAGLAMGCRIASCSTMARKNYFYPDLPKAYQISQDAQPLCRGGELCFETSEGPCRVGIERIHIEEDAGKLIHRPDGTCIDHNRCGVPLIEVVTEPGLSTPEQARACVGALRELLRCIGVCDGRMQEGSLRCDVNLSVRRPGEGPGERTEIKNLNSLLFIQKAVEQEWHRQAELLLSGGRVQMQTRRFDEKSGTTVRMRQKESAADYRFFPEPDLMPIGLEEGEIAALAAALPELPAQRRARYAAMGLGAEAAGRLASDRALSDCFDAAAEETAYPKLLANLLLGPMCRLSTGESFSCPVQPGRLAALCELWGEERINASTAKRLAERLWTDPGHPQDMVEAEGLGLICGEQELAAGISEVLADNRELLEACRGGRQAAEKALMGRCMAHFGGRAHPQRLAGLLEQAIREA